jgi:hypothetical protein
MKVYVVMVCDRHDDPDPVLFTDERSALDEARAAAQDLGCAVQTTPDGWLFLATHVEGDSVWVVEKELNA